MRMLKASQGITKQRSVQSVPKPHTTLHIEHKGALVQGFWVNHPRVTKLVPKDALT